MFARTMAAGAAAGPVLLTAAWLVLGFLSPGYSLWGTWVSPYSAVSQPVSGLGLGETGPYMNAAFLVSGALMIAGAAGIFGLIDDLDPRWRRLCAVLLALPGAGAVIDGLFTFESFLPHFAGFVLALSTIVSFPVIGFVLLGSSRWRGIGTALIAAGPLTLALTVLYFATFTPTIEGIQHGVAGLTERLLILEIQAWYVALALLAISLMKPKEIS